MATFWHKCSIAPDRQVFHPMGNFWLAMVYSYGTSVLQLNFKRKPTNIETRQTLPRIMIVYFLFLGFLDYQNVLFFLLRVLGASMNFATGARSGTFFNNDMIKKVSLTKNFYFLVILSNAGGLKVVLIYKFL